jgi:hypothetical protein
MAFTSLQYSRKDKSWDHASLLPRLRCQKERPKSRPGFRVWYLHLFESGLLLVVILSPENVRFELGAPDLEHAWDNCNIFKQFKWILRFFTMVLVWVLVHPRPKSLLPQVVGAYSLES